MHTMICGGRNHDLTPVETAWLDELWQTLPITALIPGGSRQLDTATIAWGQSRRIPVEPIPADWHPAHAHGALRSAAYLKLLLTHLSPADLALVALPGDSGTAFLVEQARVAGIAVYVYAETSKENSMPDMTVPETPVASPIPQLDDVEDIEDIADPVVPATLVDALQEPQEADNTTSAVVSPTMTPEWQQHEALLQGFLGHLLRRLDAEMIGNGKELMRTIDGMGMSVKGWVEAFAGHNEHAQYQLSGVLEKLTQDGIALRHDPYEATVQTVSPEGYPVAIQVRKGDAGALVEALPALMQWLAQEHYKPLV